jgi:hypothetical protein
VLLEMLDELAVSSRSRRNPRAIKRKMSGWPVRKRGADGTGKVVLKIDILLTPHPRAKRKPRTQNTGKKVADGPIPMDPGSSAGTKSWTARSACPDPRAIQG